MVDTRTMGLPPFSLLVATLIALPTLAKGFFNIETSKRGDRQLAADPQSPRHVCSHRRLGLFQSYVCGGQRLRAHRLLGGYERAARLRLFPHEYLAIQGGAMATRATS